MLANILIFILRESVDHIALILLLDKSRTHVLSQNVLFMSIFVSTQLLQPINQWLKVLCVTVQHHYHFLANNTYPSQLEINISNHQSLSSPANT